MSLKNSRPPRTSECDLIGNRIFADLISLGFPDKIILDLGSAPKPVTGVLKTEMRTPGVTEGRMPGEDRGRGWIMKRQEGVLP